jgi:hypothetical protein
MMNIHVDILSEQFMTVRLMILLARSMRSSLASRRRRSSLSTTMDLTPVLRAPSRESQGKALIKSMKNQPLR